MNAPTMAGNCFLAGNRFLARDGFLATKMDPMKLPMATNCSSPLAMAGNCLLATKMDPMKVPMATMLSSPLTLGRLQGWNGSPTDLSLNNIQIFWATMCPRRRGSWDLTGTLQEAASPWSPRGRPYERALKKWIKRRAPLDLRPPRACSTLET